MNDQKIPEGRYSLRKRAKVDQEDESTSSKEIKKRLNDFLKFFTKHKQNIAEMKFGDCIKLIKLESEITQTIESMLFNGSWDTNSGIEDRVFHETIKRDDWPLLKKLINHGLVQKSVCNHETPPLFEIIAEKRIKWIELLHKSGVSLDNQKMKSGKPLLHFVLEQKDIDTKFVRQLLSCGAELSTKDENDLTPLHYLLSKQISMSAYEKKSFAKLFLEFGADPNTHSKMVRETPLHTAVRNKNFEVVYFLIMHGADVNLKNAKNQTAFQLTVEFDRAWDEHSYEFQICFFFAQYIYWLKMQGKHVDKQNLSTTRNSIVIYNYTRIDTTKIRTRHESNALSILLWSESKLANHYRTGELDISKIIVKTPFKYWRRIFKFRIKKARQRNVLLDKCEKSFMQFSQLPSVFVHEMLKLLMTTDLRSLYAALYPKSFTEKVVIEPVKLLVNDDDDWMMGNEVWLDSSVDERSPSPLEINEEPSSDDSINSDDVSESSVSEEELYPYWFLL